jgi:methyl-accepting chemotaxis protein
MKFIRNMKLAQKISILLIYFLIFLLVIGLGAITQLSNANRNIKELNNSRLTPIIALENTKSDIEYIKTLGSSLMDETDEDTLKTNQDEIAKYKTSVDTELAKHKNDPQFKTLLENYTAFIAAKDAFEATMGQRAAQQQAGAQGQAGAQLAQQGPPTEVTNYDKVKITLIESFDKIINNYVALANQTYTDSEKSYRNMLIAYIALIAVCIALAVVLSIVIIGSIVVPVRKVTTKLKEISQSNGDLTQRIGYKSRDEIGQLSSSFDMFMDKLQGIISEVSLSAETITLSSVELNKAATATTESLDEISNTIVNIASSTSDGAAAAEETTASLTEAARFSEATSNASKNTTYNSKKAKEAAEEGAEKILEIVSAITDIEASSNEVSKMINELDDSSKKIGDIIQIITSISEQTNLLALNASIEAARAGEAGKGFSVVADEIRKLADQSNNAAKGISDLVKENQHKSASAVNSVNQVEVKVSHGVNKASEVRESINNIIENIQGIVNEIEQIDNANEQQAQSSKEIERAISSIAATSNEIAGSTENMSASIQEELGTMTEIEKTTDKLSEMAKKLSELTSGFTV